MLRTDLNADFFLHGVRFLNKEVPDQTEANHEVAIRIGRRRIVVLLREKGIEVFQGKEHPHGLDPEIDKIIHEWKATELPVILQIEFGDQRIVGVHVVLTKILKSDSRLQVHRFAFENIVRVVERVAGHEIGDPEEIFSAGYLVVDELIVKPEIAKPEFLAEIDPEVAQRFAGLGGRGLTCFIRLFKIGVVFNIGPSDRSVKPFVRVKDDLEPIELLVLEVVDPVVVFVAALIEQEIKVWGAAVAENTGTRCEQAV